MNPSAGFTASNCAPFSTTRATASGDDGTGNVAPNTQDDNLSTRWSGPGKGAWLSMDLGRSQTLSGAAIAWHQGNTRQNHFTLSTSEDGATFTQVYAGTSALTTAAQTYPFPNARTARYLRITVNGNTVNDWASIAEARACGAASTPTPPPSAPTTDSGPALPRLPYLQSVGTSSAIVAFRTSVSCAPFVRYGEGMDLSRTATAPALGWRHAVVLDGLSAGKTYSYVVEACGSVTGVRQFKTASLPGTPVHFTAMGDFGTGSSSQSKVLALLGQPARHGEFLLTLGDNAYTSGTEAEFQSNMFKPMASMLRETPLFTSPGNHEYVTDQGQPYLDNFYLPSNNPEKTERYYSFDWGSVHFVSLDSNCVIGLASASRCTLAAQKNWLIQDLAATKQPWKVVFFHHPIWSSGDHGSQLKMRREFVPVFEQYGVDLVLTGHDHQYERSKAMKGEAIATTSGIPYLVVGSGGAHMPAYPGSKPAWSAYRDNTRSGYLDVVVSGGTLAARFFATDGNVYDSLNLTKALPAVDPEPAPVTSTSMDAPPGPQDDPARQPAFLHEAPAAPADTPESVADEPDPVDPASIGQP
ncbi:discoidin domain-containing protein [Melittangium boletus]|uniref:discoidin domain-containing protein n=1 Tax=Melittangium boletus TaxID=83453 RepID=UPI003DA65F89